MLVYFPLLCLIDIESARIEGTHIPTKIPPSLSPLNQRKTENKNDINAKMIGYYFKKNFAIVIFVSFY